MSERWEYTDEEIWFMDELELYCRMQNICEAYSNGRRLADNLRERWIRLRKNLIYPTFWPIAKHLADVNKMQMHEASAKAHAQINRIKHSQKLPKGIKKDLQETILNIIKKEVNICYLCGRPIKDKKDLHIEHVIPLSRGGTNTPDNIKPAHSSCNYSKHTQTAEEYWGCCHRPITAE